MLTVEDEAFWEGLAPVTFGQLPRLQDQVTVIGCDLLRFEAVADHRINLPVALAALQSSDSKVITKAAFAEARQAKFMLRLQQVLLCCIAGSRLVGRAFQ